MKRACLEIQAAVSKNTPYALYTTGVETSFIHIVIIFIIISYEISLRYRKKYGDMVSIMYKNIIKMINNVYWFLHNIFDVVEIFEALFRNHS